jgi:hypothetical protein
VIDLEDLTSIGPADGRFDLKAHPGKLDLPLGTTLNDFRVDLGVDGTTLLPHTQAKRILDRLKRLAHGRDLPDAAACARFDTQTRSGEDMQAAQQLLAAAIASIVGKSEERAVASLFTPGGTHALRGEFAGSGDFEVVAWLAVLPEADT